MSNVLTRDTLLIEAAALATNEGLSANAKIELMTSLGNAAQAKSIQPSDASPIFDAYLAAKESTVNDKTEVVGNGKTGAKVTEGYARKTKSEWKQVISCGGHPTADGPEALALAKDIATSKGIHVYDAMIKIAREQIKVQDTLTREEVEAHLAGDAKSKDKSELKVLKDVAKSLEKVIKGIDATDDDEGRPPYASQEAIDALNKINARIADITPKVADAVAALMKSGFSEAEAKSMVRKV